VNPTSGNVEKAIITQTDLSSAQHAFVWYSETQQVLASTPTFRIEHEGTYEVVAKNAQTGCKSVPTSFTISNSSVAKVSYRVDDLIDNLNIITIVAQGKGTYEYSIDGGAYQESATFENVEGGVHIVRVRDINGCGIEIVTPMVVEFPKFFTPNGDGYNDVWNIESLTSKKDANIQIFDRYGKMIMQIKPNGTGWDGQLNGAQLPSDDYWFTVQFTHLGKSYEYKSHFTLKR
jgi:valyl-tRNA synthetase